MTTDGNVPLELIRIWQEKTQAFFSDPKSVELMMNNIQMSQSFFKKMQETGYEYKKHNAAQADDSTDDARDAIYLLKLRVTALEQRIAQLESCSDK